MALSEKDIVITPNRGQTNDPKIVFSGADASTSAQNITLNVYPTNSGTLSFEGSAGQLLSISNTMSGSIFSVNDVSGIPSIEVFDSGNIRMNHFSGTLMVGDLEYDNDADSKVKVQGRVDTNMFNRESGFLSKRANGSLSAKTAVLANERIGFIIGSAYGTTGYTHSAAINFYAAENQSDTVHSSYITFDTAASTGARVERVRIDKDGTVLVKGMVYVGYGGASSSIEMSDSDEGARTIHCNSQRIGFLTQAGGWGSWCYDDGSWESIGNITAYSDERLKTNWRDVPSNFVELLSKVKSGIYDRTDMQKTQVGVSAQSLREVLPDAVTEGNDENKTLGVAYGNAALLASVELAKEVVSLKAEIQELKQIVKGLLNG